MRELRFEIFPKTDDQPELRFYRDATGPFESRRLDSTEVERLLKLADAEYRRPFTGDLRRLGRELFDLLDGTDVGWLRSARGRGRKSLAVRLDVSNAPPPLDRLVHLPWELLTDGTTNLGAAAKGAVVPVRQLDDEEQAVEIANRPLRILFLAADPIGGESSLDYEREESLILDATVDAQLELQVEETGSLDGLRARLDGFGSDAGDDRSYFDIVHLTGHAVVKPSNRAKSIANDGEDNRPTGPIFLMEDSHGARHEVTPDELANAFDETWPRLIFLSGCETGKADKNGALPSFAQALVDAGAPAVLGWGLKVTDPAATEAARALYEELAKGKRLDDAVAAARSAVYEVEQETSGASGRGDWHLLRLYTDATPLGAHVTSPSRAGRKRLTVRPAVQIFLDAGSDSEVCPPERFVGRRRQIQASLRTLQSKPGSDDHAEGILLHGMGGLGKSSLAARLCERLPHRRLVLVGKLDEGGLQKELSHLLAEPNLTEVLYDDRRELGQRLRLVLKALQDNPEAKPILFVLDDFEQNVQNHKTDPKRDEETGRAVLEPQPLAVLTALLSAIRESASDSRAIVTCRYELALPGPARLEPIELLHFEGAALRKKKAQLQTFQEESGVKDEVKERMLSLAGGNPRLLERLDKVAASKKTKVEPILEALEVVAEEFREDTLLKFLLKQQTDDCRKLLASLSLIHLPIDLATAKAIIRTPDLQLHLDHASAVGLVETAIPPGSNQPSVFISPILAPLLAGELSKAQRTTIERRACQRLYDAWWKTNEKPTEPRALEVVRLAQAAEEQEIAVKITQTLGHFWFNRARYRDAVALCRFVGETFDDYRIHAALARSESVLGNSKEALRHYRHAVETAPPLEEVLEEDQQEIPAALHNMALLVAQQGDPKEAMKLWKQTLAIQKTNKDVQGRSATLHAMAGVVARQGDIPRAMELWKQSLEIQKATGEVKGKAATLHQMAGVVAQQGDVPRAMELWKQSLEIKETIGDVQGKAATLAYMAWAAVQQGENEKALSLNLEAAQALGEVRAFGDLISVLGNLGVSEVPEQEMYLCQAFWLVARIQAPLTDTLSLGAATVQHLEPSSALSKWVAAATAALVHSRACEHPEGETLQQDSIGLLGSCAKAREISPEELGDWIKREKLNDPEVVFPTLFAQLEEIIGNSWLFDPETVGN